MKKNLFLILVAVLVVANVFAQNTFNLIVFSEDAEPFYAFVNGIKQNDKPETNIKITDLNSTNLNLRIVFENKANPQLKQNFMLENGFEHTINLKRNMKKVLKMRYFAKTPLESAANTDVTTIPYHTTETPTGGSSENTQVTTTTGSPTNGSTTTNNNNTSVTISAGGMINMNVQVNETVTQSSSSTTTTSSSTTTPPKSHGGSFNTLPVEPKPVAVNTGCSGPMTTAAYEKMKKTINDKPFSDTKMSTAKIATKNACLSTDQIAGICKLFSMDDDRLEYAKYAYDACTDKTNLFHLSEVFSFSTTTEEFNAFLEKK
jgi:hypothetical protein